MKFYNQKLEKKMRIWQSNFEKQNKTIDTQLLVNKITK